MTKKFLEFLLFVFGPLILNGRWCIWFFALLLLMMMGDTITAIRMEIPNIETVNRITGKFVDTAQGYRKGALYDIGIMDRSGIIHKCDCEPLGYSNCLGRKPSDYAEIVDQLDPEVLNNHAPQKAIIKWLAGRDGEVWMYPNRSLFGDRNSCYQISSDTHILQSFEQSVREYSKVKNGINVYLFWLIVLSGAFFLLIFIIVRIYEYLKTKSVES